MGDEYSIRFHAPDPSSVEDVLKHFHLKPESPSQPSRLEFRKDSANQGMPDASVHIEPGGLYFCDYGGFGREFLGHLVASLVSSFGSVTIADYE